jgi:hypothetical protein
MQIFQALILNDYQDAPYAEWVKIKRKSIETRMKRLFAYRGDIVICCGKTNSVSSNAGKALCMVNIYDGGPMKKEDEEAACIGWHPDRKSLYLKDWRKFDTEFLFAPYAIKKNFQGIFALALPDEFILTPY